MWLSQCLSCIPGCWTRVRAAYLSVNLTRSYISDRDSTGLGEVGNTIYIHAFCRLPSLPPDNDGLLATMMKIITDTQSRESLRKILINEGQVQYLFANLSRELRRENHSDTQLHCIVDILTMVTLLVAPEHIPQILKSRQILLFLYPPWSWPCRWRCDGNCAAAK